MTRTGSVKIDLKRPSKNEGQGFKTRKNLGERVKRSSFTSVHQVDEE